MSAESTDLLVLAGAILVMMAALGGLKALAKRRARDTRRAWTRLKMRSDPPARP